MTAAVAYRSEGPISSTSSSMLVRWLPSRSWYDRWRRRPCAMTRLPFVSEPDTCSANSPQTLERRNSASPSFHSFACRSNVRGVEAIVKFATALPFCVYRS